MKRSHNVLTLSGTGFLVATILAVLFGIILIAGCGGGGGEGGGAVPNVNTPTQQPTVAPEITGFIKGKVIDKEGKSLKTYLKLYQLNLNGSAATSAEGSTSDSGEFNFPGLKPGGWRIEAFKNQAESGGNPLAAKNVDVTQSGSDITLIEGNVEPIPGPTVNPTGVPTGSPTVTPTGNPTQTPTGVPTTPPTSTPVATPTVPSGNYLQVNGVPSGGKIEAQPLLNLGNYSWAEFSPADRSQPDDHRYQVTGLPANVISSTEVGGVCYLTSLTVGSNYSILIKDSSGNIVGSKYLQFAAGTNFFVYSTPTATTNFRLSVTEQTHTSTEILNNLLRCVMIVRTGDGKYSRHIVTSWRDYYDDYKDWYVDLANFPQGNATVEILLYDKFGNLPYGSTVKSFYVSGTESEITVPITDWSTKNLGITETQGVVRHDIGSQVGSNWYIPVMSTTSDKYAWEKTGGYQFNADGLKVVKAKVSFDSNDLLSTSKIIRIDATGNPGDWNRRECLERDTKGGSNQYERIILTVSKNTTYTFSILLPPGYKGGATIESLEIYDVATAQLGDAIYK